MATSSVVQHRPTATERATVPRPGRDRFVDVLGAFAILALVAQHWMPPALSGEHAIPTDGGSPTVLGGWPSTWLSPVVPLILFAGGSATTIGLRSVMATGRRTSSWLADRITRSALPVLALVTVWLSLHHLVIAAGVPALPVHSADEMIGRLLWFLIGYAALATLTPVLVRLHERWLGREVIVMAAVVVAVDILHVAGSEQASRLDSANVVLVLAAIYQIGIAYGQGRFDEAGRSQLLSLCAGGSLAAALALAPYVLSAITMPGEPPSGMNPPAVALLALGLAQLGLALACRDALGRWAAHRPVATMLDWIRVRAVTIYLWHVPALAVLAGFTVVGDGGPQPFGAGWYSNVAVRLAVLMVGLGGFVRAFGHRERLAPHRRTTPSPRGWGWPQPGLTGLPGGIGAGDTKDLRHEREPDEPERRGHRCRGTAGEPAATRP